MRPSLPDLGLCIVIGGGICSGKTAVAHALAAKLGCPAVSFGDYVRQRAHEAGLSGDRASLQSFGASLVADPAAFVGGFLATVPPVESKGCLIVEGLRHRSVAEVLRQTPFADQLIIAVVSTTYQERRRRYVGRGDGTSDEFAQVDGHQTDSEHADLELLADIVVNGDRPPDAVVDEIASAVIQRHPP